MKPIKLIIRKKTIVHTNEGSKYPLRSDWCQVYSIDYTQCETFFSHIFTDSQFALWLAQNFGLGEYYVQAWKKGHEGFWLFAKIICKEETYCRVPKRYTQEDVEMRRLKGDYNRINRQIKDTQDEEEKATIKEQAADVLDEYELNKDIKAMDSTKKSGCYPYLKTIMPIFKEHEYEALGTIHYEEPRKPRKAKEHQQQEQLTPEQIEDSYVGDVI